MTTTIEQSMADHRASSAQIKAERQTIAVEAERFGNALLAERRRLGIPDPDGADWGVRMRKYQIGLRALALGALEPDFAVEEVPASLREWLANPLTDQPADDEDLRMLVDLIREAQ